MKKQILVCSAAAAFFLSSPAFADSNDGKPGILEKIIDKTVEVFTEDGDEHDHDGSENPGSHGRENAAEHIEENIEKHGGEHKGLENALSNKDGSKGDHEHHGEDGSLVDEIVEDVAEEAKDALGVDSSGEVSEDSAADDRGQYHGRGDSGHPGKGRGHGKD